MMKKLLCAMLGLLWAIPSWGACYDYTSATGTASQIGTPTPDNPIYPTFYKQGDMVLRKVGNIADTYDATTGKITRRVGEYTFTGSESISTQYNVYGITTIPYDMNKVTDASLCSHNKTYINSVVTGNRTFDKFLFFTNVNTVGFGANDTPSEITDATTFKQWLAAQYAAGTPVKIYYPLKTEVVEDWTATQWCEKIEVASTKYVETQFSGLSASLAAAVATVNTVVTNTITQAASIATLQSGKQTRPADDTCPAGKKCLLVTDENNVPHWYEIFDPINRWLEAWIAAGKPAPQHTSNSDTLLRWHGNPNFRETYIDGYRDVYVRQWDASPARTVGGMYQTLLAGDIENAGTWAVEYDGTEGDGVNAGVVYGIAKCTTVTQNFATKLTSENESAFYELPAPVGQTDNANYPRENFKNCWCKMTAVGVPGADGTAANGAVYPVNSASSAWVFRDLRGSASDCANYCTFYCVDNIRSVPGFRTAVFGLSD